VSHSTQCQQRKITQAYHVICGDCARERDVCAKCLQSREIVPSYVEWDYAHTDDDAMQPYY